LVHSVRSLPTIAPQTSLLTSSSASLSSLSSLTPTTAQGDVDWLETVESKPMEQDRIRQLVIGVVSEATGDTEGALKLLDLKTGAEFCTLVS